MKKATSLANWWRKLAIDHASLVDASATHSALVIEAGVRLRDEFEQSANPLSLLNELAGAITWTRAGRPRFVLSKSMAAVLMATKAPPLEALPFDAFIIELPREYLQCPGPTDWPTQIGVFSYVTDGCRTLYFEIGSDVCADVTECLSVSPLDLPVAEDARSLSLGDMSERNLMALSRQSDEVLKMNIADGVASEARAPIRLIANLCAYVTQYKECVKPRSSNPRKTENVADVSTPHGISVSSAFRESAIRLVSARSFAQAKRVLRHMVRGHWKRQATGPGRTQRQMRWIAPYLRGDGKFGAVVEKAITMDAPN